VLGLVRVRIGGGLSVRSRVAVFHREAAQSAFDDRPESGAFHGLTDGAVPTVLERGAGHLDPVLLFGQLGQLVIDQVPSGLPFACDETLDLSQREPDLPEEEDHTDVPDCRRGITPSSRRPSYRPHQSTFVVVPQGGRGHTVRSDSSPIDSNLGVTGEATVRSVGGSLVGIDFKRTGSALLT